MILDLRSPFLIISGSWNPAVLDPQWIRTILFSLPDQDQHSLFLVQPSVRDLDDQNQLTPQGNTVYYYSNVGVRCNSNQFELFINEVEKDTFDLAEKTIRGLTEIFQYTPISSYGINFSFFDTIPEANICDTLKIYDDFDPKLRISSTDIRTKLFESNEYDLNFRRLLDDDGVELYFNFHHSVNRISELSKLSHNAFNQYFDKIFELFSKQYNISPISEIEIERHKF